MSSGNERTATPRVVLGSQDLATAAILRLANDRGSGGAVVLYNLAWTIFLLPWAVLAVPLATATFPTLTARWQSGERTAYADILARTTRATVVATAGAAALLVATALPASRVLVLGAPGGVEPHVLARAIVAFAPGIVGFGLTALASRAYFATGDAGVPAAATATGWLVVVAADVAFVAALPRGWAAAALGLGNSVGLTLAGGWLVAGLRRRTSGASAQGLATTATVAGCAAVLSAGAGYELARALPQAGIAGSVALALVVAAVALALFTAVVARWDRATLELLLRRGRTDG